MSDSVPCRAVGVKLFQAPRYIRNVGALITVLLRDLIPHKLTLMQLLAGRLRCQYLLLHPNNTSESLCTRMTTGEQYKEQCGCFSFPLFVPLHRTTWLQEASIGWNSVHSAFTDKPLTSKSVKIGGRGAHIYPTNSMTETVCGDFTLSPAAGP